MLGLPLLQEASIDRALYTPKEWIIKGEISSIVIKIIVEELFLLNIAFKYF